MPNRGQQLGRRRPFVRRPGIGKFPPWDGMNREGDAASCPANAFRMLINTRTDDSEIWCRGGQSPINPDDELDGCVSGVFPPEFEPPDQAFTRLIIAERGASIDALMFCPNESEEVLVSGQWLNSGVELIYWSGERLLAIRCIDNDGRDGFIDEYRINTSSGLSQVEQIGSPAGIELSWEGFPGGVVLAGGEYYMARYEGADTFDRITFGASDFEFDSEAASGGNSFVTASVDGRVYYISKGSSVAEMSVRSPATGTYSQVTFPTGFEPIPGGATDGVQLHSWAWHAGKLYIAGALSSSLAICAYDPVANTISTARTISGTAVDHCPMAVHKGVLYFAYGLSGGAERVGMLRKGVWTDSIAAFSAPADIYDLCSFQDHLYMTKAEFLLRCSDPSSDPTFETFFESDSGFDLGAMVAVP